MNFGALIGVITELGQLVADMKADGSFKEIMEAEQAIEKVIKTNPNFKELVEKLKQIKLGE